MPILVYFSVVLVRLPIKGIRMHVYRQLVFDSLIIYWECNKFYGMKAVQPAILCCMVWWGVRSSCYKLVTVKVDA